MGFGAFGKMPSLGDFFRIGLPAETVGLWDAWLQGVMVAAREALGEGFHACYMRAPIWRFSLAPGVLGQSAVVGVMMPSVDRVGRQFPLVLMAATEARAGPGAALRGFLTQSAALDAAEAIALDALEDDMQRDDLATRLAAMSVSAEPRPATLLHGTRHTAVIASAPRCLCGDIAAELPAGGLHRAGLWSADVDGVVRTLFCDGLPDKEQAVGLFDLDAPLWTGRAA
jgi:type VI secretion system protein ImpM